MKKKLFAILFISCMIFTTLTGCKQNQVAEDQTAEEIAIPKTQYLATSEEAAELKAEFFSYAENSAIVQNSDTWNLDDGTMITFHVEQLPDIPENLHVYYDEDDEYGTRRPEEYNYAYKIWASVVEPGYENVTESEQDAQATEIEASTEESTGIEEIPDASDVVGNNIPYEFVLNPHMLPADEENGILFGYNVAWEEGSSDNGKTGSFDMFPFYIFTDSDNFYVEFYETKSDLPTGVLVQIFSPTSNNETTD